MEATAREVLALYEDEEASFEQAARLNQGAGLPPGLDTRHLRDLDASQATPFIRCSKRSWVLVTPKGRTRPNASRPRETLPLGPLGAAAPELCECRRCRPSDAGSGDCGQRMSGSARGPRYA